MFIDMKNIQSVFVDCKTMLTDLSSSICICGFCRLDHALAPYNEYSLYLTDSLDTVKSTIPIPNMHILLCAEKEFSNISALSDLWDIPVSLLLVSGCSLEKAEFLLSDFFNENCGRGLFADSLLDILFTENGIQAMVDKIYPAFNNPLMVFDAGYHLIAANLEEVKKSPFGRNIVEHGGFSEHEFELVNHFNHIHQKIIHSPFPILVHHPELGFDQLICAINTSKNMGHIVLNALNQPFHKHDADFLWLLQKAIDQQLKKDEFIRNNRGFHYEYFIRDLLDRKIATAPQHMERLEYVEEEFRGLLYCIVVETARSSSTLNTLHVRSEFERSFPDTKTLLYNGEIIILINKKNMSELSKKELKELNKICSEHGIFAGMSNCFKDILELYEFFKQALRAIELGIGERNKPSLYIYNEYYTQHVTNIFLQKESPDTFCHPKLRLLFSYDKSHETHLAETLYMYLVNERNYTLAAEAMYIHRNTMIYRIKKIKEIADIHYEDYKERQYLILSYELNQQ